MDDCGSIGAMWFAKRFLLAASLFIAGCATPGSSPLTALLEGRSSAVLVFLAPDCPLSQNYTATLNELRSQFQPKGIEFFGVFSGAAAVDGADQFVKAYAIRFPVLSDTKYQLADTLGAMVTPQVFVVDGRGRTMYDGAIDNRAPELGQRRTVITEHYLLDALGGVVEGRDVLLKTTRPIGCFIERTQPS